MKQDLNNSDEIKKYFRSQTEICFSCDLFNDKETHGSKIIMLFAEVFSFLVDNYGINNVSNLIINYSNTTNFKKWFWAIKNKLEQYIGEEPSFYEIGKWIGKGFFLKICLSVIIYNSFILDNNILNSLIHKQKKLIKELKNESFIKNNQIIIQEFNNSSYSLLNENIVLTIDDEYFYLENVI